ncbi:ORC2-domain-containing protein [Backusella circina FSU 941]|nr:ORC2-domain-containing protein [Backusella circina FSU 941]
MDVKVQTDEEIPIHIFNIVSKETAKQEEKIAQRFKAKQRGGKRAPRVLDLGLTVNQKENAKRKKIELESIEETQYKPAVDHDKENIDHTTGKSMFSFQQLSKKSTSTMMGKVLNEENKGSTMSAATGTTTRKQKNATILNRKRIEQRLASLKDDANSSNEEDNNQDDDDEDEDEEEFMGLRKKSKKSAFEEPDGYERYFQDLHGSSKTSNNTLSQLQVLEPQEFHDLLQTTHKKHNQEIEVLSDLHKQNFAQWQFELQSGFNVVFYGYGSKRNLLNHFSRDVLTDGPLIVVNGYFPSISIKDILLKITVGVLEHTGSSLGQIQDHVNFICNYFKQEDRAYECLYLVVHNLDGASLRNERAQGALSMLASCPNIHLIASVDHINAGLLWDNAKSRRFNWVWHDITTYEDYLVETSFENSMLIRSGEVGGSRGVQYVLASLTTNARGVFRILAEHQLLEMEMANMEGRANESVGLSYGQYYQKCREGFYVSNDLTLRTELTEFRDHKIISTKKAPDGTELFFIPLDKATLLSIVETMA